MFMNENGKFDRVWIGSRYELMNDYKLRARKEKVIEIKYDLALNFTVHHAEGIENPSIHPSKNYYFVVFSFQDETDFYTLPVPGFPNPVWRQYFKIVLRSPNHSYAFMNMEVVRLISRSDPGPSSGMVVVGRAQIPLPKEVSMRKDGRFKLVKLGVDGCKVKGHIVVSMELEKLYHLGKIN